MKKKIVVILGPTASGKSDLGVIMAKKFNGEIVSADSRQVYKGMDIGSGKITKKEKEGVPHYLLDVAGPKKVFTVFDYKNLANKAIGKILKKNKLPIIVGGTGFYIQSIVDNFILPEIKPNAKLRRELTKLSSKQLFDYLQKIDSQRAEKIDAQNPRRLIRAIEIAKELGSVPPLKKGSCNYLALLIGIKIDFKNLKERIHKRLVKRIKQGMVAEVKRLREGGVPWRRLENLGLEYRYLSYFLQGKMSKEEMFIKLESEIFKYAKRQMTWFKKDKRIIWIENNPIKVAILVKKFLG